MRSRCYLFTAVAILFASATFANQEDAGFKRQLIERNSFDGKVIVMPTLLQRYAQGPGGGFMDTTIASTATSTSATTSASTSTSESLSTTVSQTFKSTSATGRSASNSLSSATFSGTASASSISASSSMMSKTAISTASSSSTTTGAAASNSSEAASSKIFHWTSAEIAATSILLVALVAGLAAISFFKFQAVRKQQVKRPRQQLAHTHQRSRDLEAVPMIERIPPTGSLGIYSDTRSRSSLLSVGSAGTLYGPPKTPSDITSPVEFQQATTVSYLRAPIHQVSNISRATSRSNGVGQFTIPARSMTPPAIRRLNYFDRSITPPSQLRVASSASSPDLRSSATNPSQPLHRAFSFQSGQINILPQITTHTPSTSIQSVNAVQNDSAVIMPISSLVRSARSQSASLQEARSPPRSPISPI